MNSVLLIVVDGLKTITPIRLLLGRTAAPKHFTSWLEYLYFFGGGGRLERLHLLAANADANKFHKYNSWSVK